MRYFALACDYDSTLADAGIVRPSTVAALRRLAASGRKLILVTGRELDDLRRVFPPNGIFHRIVAENGALLYNPANRQARALADPPSPRFIEALRRARIEPLSIGASIVATLQPNGEAVLKVIHELGLEMQVIYNRDAAMILPSGVNKATGLRAALPEVGLSPHNAVGVGDAENDHALLNVCEFRVAVANAIPTLKERADFVTTEPNGKGIEELIERMLFDDLKSLEPREPRYPILIGEASGKDVAIPSYGASLVIAGPPAAGKSTAITSIVERLLDDRYQVCLIDPEGDYDDLEKIVALGNPSRAPEVSEVVAALQKPKTSVAVNLLGLPLADRPLFLASLFPQIQDLRARTGRPHWVIIDEAHHLLPSSPSPAMASIPSDFANLLLITVDVSAVWPDALKMMKGIMAVGPSPNDTIGDFSRVIERPSPARAAFALKPGEICLWMIDDARGGPIAVRVQPSATEKRRHKRKYAEGRLDADNSFFFKGPDGKLNLRAHNLMMFNQIAEGVDDETWLFHLRQHDYSKWMGEAIKDEVLAAEVARIEGSQHATARESRKEIIDAVNRRYTSPETAARA